MKIKKVYIATKAFINKGGRLLILREALTGENKFDPGRYDVVGGRIAPGQSIFDSLKKEAKTQTGLDIRVRKPFYVDELLSLTDEEKWHIVCIYFECTSDDNEVSLGEEYDNYEWIDPENYGQFYLYRELHKAFEYYLSLNKTDEKSSLNKKFLKLKKEQRDKD
ncbi:MAG: NUDIX domain-containing protein [Candidatus Moranbacteria bacterium]|nr:NUDIX domain-containing protein [Candidatus Moranbacteria bacterium]